MASSTSASTSTFRRVCSHPVLSAPVKMDPLRPAVRSVRWTGQLAIGLFPSMMSSARVTGSSSTLLDGRRLLSASVKLPPRPEGACPRTPSPQMLAGPLCLHPNHLWLPCHMVLCHNPPNLFRVSPTPVRPPGSWTERLPQSQISHRSL